MKKKLTIIITSAAFFVAISGANAQMMGNNVATDDHTAREEAEGGAIWQKLQNKETNCASLSDDDFGALGEYFMGQIMGDSHEAMNEMMTRMHGEESGLNLPVVVDKIFNGEFDPFFCAENNPKLFSQACFRNAGKHFRIAAKLHGVIGLR